MVSGDYGFGGLWFAGDDQLASQSMRRHDFTCRIEDWDGTRRPRVPAPTTCARFGRAEFGHPHWIARALRPRHTNGLMIIARTDPNWHCHHRCDFLRDLITLGCSDRSHQARGLTCIGCQNERYTDAPNRNRKCSLAACAPVLTRTDCRGEFFTIDTPIIISVELLLCLGDDGFCFLTRYFTASVSSLARCELIEHTELSGSWAFWVMG